MLKFKNNKKGRMLKHLSNSLKPKTELKVKPKAKPKTKKPKKA